MHQICDSAGVTSIYGTSSNNGSTPAALMADSLIATGGDYNTITVNFDACPDKRAMCIIISACSTVAVYACLVYRPGICLVLIKRAIASSKIGPSRS